MKKILLCGVLLSLIALLSSCDNEELTNNQQQQLKQTTSLRLCSENPYDEIGRLHDILFDNYLTSDNNADTIEEIATEVSNLITNSNSGQTTIPVNNEFIDWVEQILNNPEHSLEIIASETGLSVRATTKLNDFIELVSEATTNNNQEILIDIISYEKGVITDMSLTSKEKEVVLTTSSIVKYSLYNNGDRKDKDWDLSVGNIVATVYGATYSQQDALLLGLTTKIFQNHLSVKQ